MSIRHGRVYLCLSKYILRILKQSLPYGEEVRLCSLLEISLPSTATSVYFYQTIRCHNKKGGCLPTRRCDTIQFRAASPNFENNFLLHTGFIPPVRLPSQSKRTFLVYKVHPRTNHADSEGE